MGQPNLVYTCVIFSHITLVGPYKRYRVSVHSILFLMLLPHILYQFRKVGDPRVLRKVYLLLAGTARLAGGPLGTCDCGPPAPLVTQCCDQARLTLHVLACLLALFFSVITYPRFGEVGSIR
jgi:hypothetical protein